jgi:serine/threonine protein kinase/tetratricopeptide (TPR) repeat protein
VEDDGVNEPDQSRAEELFLDVLDKSPAERTAFLNQACRDNNRLRRMVEELLAADAAAGGADFLKSAFLGKVEPESLPPTQSHEVPTPERDGVLESARFRILSKHREGGIGEVLIAYDQQLRRAVAIKQIRPKWRDHDEARQRFVQEAEVTGRLEHPGVVPVYAMGIWEDGSQYYAMRFIQGDTLAEVIRLHHNPQQKLDRHSRLLGLRQILNRFVDVCNTIHYAHSHRILHRDIKPANIMVGPYGETLVVDWGLAKLLDTPPDESMTAELLEDLPSQLNVSGRQAGGTVGTPQYMSPEQAGGRVDEVGIPTDIYLLGATLYQILTGSPPHSDESITKLLQRVAQGELVSPRSLDPTISRPLEAICMKAMATDPSDRYDNCDELASDIERWMADEPVRVFRDPLWVRTGRWVRRHRTAAYSGTVAAVLLMVGTVAGSMLWSYQQTQQIQAERENEAKEAQLQATRQLRMTELRASVDVATELAEEELRSNRFASALSILRGAVASIESEAEFASRHSLLSEKAERVRRIADFYRYADETQEHNLLSRDSKAIISCTAGLRSLGILDKDDWWFWLADEDLTPDQQDRLRWAVYKQLLTLDAMLVKSDGTDVGKREAAAALIVSDRADMFRRSEAVRWFRSVAQFRLGQGRRLLGRELETSRNAADAQNLGVLCLTSAVDETFQIFFRQYKGDDSLRAARDLFSRSSKLRPGYYWVQLSLAQTEYLLALRDPDPSWRKFDSAIHAAGRCVAIEPEKCFAYADRSSMYRSAALLVTSDDELSATDRQEKTSELLKWSLADAQMASRLGVGQPWTGWQHGLALYAIGQDDQAMRRFLETSQLTYPFIEREDANLVRVDDLRGRSEAVELTSGLTISFPMDPRYHIVLASIKLNQNQIDDALESVERALATATPAADAYAVRGMVRLQRQEHQQAVEDFQRAIRLDADQAWASFGLAACHEALQQYDEALLAYQRAESIARTDEHRAGCLLGKSRVFAHMQKFDQALAAIATARQLEPACNLTTVVRTLASDYSQLVQADPEDPDTAAMKQFLQRLSRISRTTRIELTSDASTTSAYYAAVLNGGFELRTLQYWSESPVAAWLSDQGYHSNANISESVAHQGDCSLHIRGGTSKAEAVLERTGQSVPVRSNESWQARLWVKASGLGDGALRVTNGRGQTIVTIPGGTYDWTRLTAPIHVADQTADSPAIASVRLEIVSSGEGEAWIDDVEILSRR